MRVPACLILILANLAWPAAAQSVRAGIEAWQRADYAAAVRIWRPLADAGDAAATFNLAQAYRLGRGVSANLATAKKLLGRSASQGHVESQTTLGMLLLRDGERGEGLDWIKSAAEAGEPRAQLVYGTALVNGDGVTQDRLRGYAFVKQAAASGLTQARQTLADLDRLMAAQDRRKAASMKVAQRPAPDADARPKAAARATAAKAPRPTSPATITPEPRGGAWRIQLGAFSRRGAAQELFATLAPSLPGRRPYYSTVGTVTRLQVGPYESRNEAEKACAALSSRGHTCFAIQSR